mgnify:FL=1
MTDMRKCRNWQTSKTKDLVLIASVWVQVPSSALEKEKREPFIREVSSFLLGQGPVSRIEFFVFRKMECWKQINHLLCEWLEML